MEEAAAGKARLPTLESLTDCTIRRLVYYDCFRHKYCISSSICDVDGSKFLSGETSLHPINRQGIIFYQKPCLKCVTLVIFCNWQKCTVGDPYNFGTSWMSFQTHASFFISPYLIFTYFALALRYKPVTRILLARKQRFAETGFRQLRLWYLWGRLQVLRHGSIWLILRQIKAAERCLRSRKIHRSLTQSVRLIQEQSPQKTNRQTDGGCNMQVTDITK